MAQMWHLTIDCDDPAQLAKFWTAALDYAPPRGGADNSWAWCDPKPGQPGLPIHFQRVPEPKVAKHRVHIDLSAPPDEWEAEAERLIALGATRLERFDNQVYTWYTFRDPAGGEFCLVRHAP